MKMNILKRIIFPEGLSSKENEVPENKDILIYYVITGDIWDRNKIIVDNIFSFKIALDILEVMIMK